MSTPTEVYLERYHTARTRFRESGLRAAEAMTIRINKAREEFRQATTTQLYTGDPERSPSARYNREVGAAKVAYALAYDKADKRFKAEIKRAKEEAWGRA